MQTHIHLGHITMNDVNRVSNAGSEQALILRQIEGSDGRPARGIELQFVGACQSIPIRIGCRGGHDDRVSRIRFQREINLHLVSKFIDVIAGIIRRGENRNTVLNGRPIHRRSKLNSDAPVIIFSHIILPRVSANDGREGIGLVSEGFLLSEGGLAISRRCSWTNDELVGCLKV